MAGPRQTPASIERGKVISEQYKSGMTLAEVGAAHGITRERVRQIVTKLGIDKAEGGGAIRSFKNVGDKVAAIRTKSDRQEIRCRATWGMSLSDYKAHIATHGTTVKAMSPMGKYVQQKNNALRRGISWDFTFADWWRVWQESGKWNQRGLGAGLYVMARYGDGDAPYSVDTVYICTQSQNSKDSFLVSPASVRFANKGNKMGSGKGFSYLPNASKNNPYMAQCGGRYIGSYPTAELARDAYLKVASGEIKLPDSKSQIKITNEQALLIREDPRDYRAIAKDYGVHNSTICHIKTKRTWASI